MMVSDGICVPKLVSVFRMNILFSVAVFNVVRQQILEELGLDLLFLRYTWGVMAYDPVSMKLLADSSRAGKAAWFCLLHSKPWITVKKILVSSKLVNILVTSSTHACETRN